jgi:hypothetical protein
MLLAGLLVSTVIEKENYGGGKNKIGILQRL